MALSALALNAQLAGNVEQGEKIVAKRAANREALQKFMDSRAELGQKVTPEQAMSFASELTNGGSFIYGFAPDMVTESILQDQNRQATLQQEAQAATMLKNLNEQERSLEGMLPFTDDDDITLVSNLSQQNPALKPILDKYATKIPEMRQRREQEAISNIMRDAVFTNEATPDNVEDLFPGLNKRTYDALKTRAKYVEEDRNIKNIDRFITKFREIKGSLTSDDRTFEITLDGNIAVAAAQTGFKISPNDKLYKDIRNSILAEREKVKREMAIKAFEERNVILQDPNFQVLAKQGYQEEAIKYIKSVYSTHPVLGEIPDDIWRSIIFGMGSANTAVNLTNTHSNLQQAAIVSFDEGQKHSAGIIATGLDEKYKPVAAIITNAFLLPEDFIAANNIKKDIESGMSVEEIVGKHNLKPASSRLEAVNERVNNYTASMPPVGKSVREFLDETVRSSSLQTLLSKGATPEEMYDFFNITAEKALKIPGAVAADIYRWRDQHAAEYASAMEVNKKVDEAESKKAMFQKSLNDTLAKYNAAVDAGAPRNEVEALAKAIRELETILKLEPQTLRPPRPTHASPWGSPSSPFGSQDGSLLEPSNSPYQSP